MATSSIAGTKKVTEDNQQIFLGEWKPIPKEDFLSSLPPGTYLLQSNELIDLNTRISNIIFPELSLSGRYHKCFNRVHMKTEKDFLAAIRQLEKEIDARDEQLIEVADGRDDPLLNMLRRHLDKLLITAYDHYIQVQPDYRCIIDRERMIIINEDEDHELLSKNKMEEEVVPVGPSNKALEKGVSSPNQGLEGVSSAVAPNQDLQEGVSSSVAHKKMPKCSVCVRHLEDFIPQQMMAIYRESYWKKQGRKMQKVVSSVGGKRKRAKSSIGRKPKRKRAVS